MERSGNGREFKVVYTIVERGQKKHWVRIGAAYTNRDGSLNVYLDAVPTNGQLQIRDYRPFDERGRSNGAELIAGPNGWAEAGSLDG
ncbi:MAG: hypothetical protein NZ898_04730 [Myxococcota bacterium]|nr:hypothetical protein [Myxococcota bacterium]MDW8361516.1 hypothetical protein [Myxococcales bacterium]